MQTTAAGIASSAIAMRRARAQEAAETDGPVTREANVQVEMRDGTRLATDIYVPGNQPPEDVDREFPTLVTRTPYNKEYSQETAEAFARWGYAVVTQDVRGKFASEGDFYPYRSEGNAENEDGYDTVEWAADQSWSNGRVGTYGISYLAGTQWALAQNDELPPHLEAMAPGYAVSSYYGQGAYSGGACLLSHNIDYLTGFAIERYRREHPDLEEAFSAADIEELTDLEKAQETMMELYWELPVEPFEPHEEVGYEWLSDWHTHETYDEYWQAQDNTRVYDNVDVPVLEYGGWYDIFTQGSIQNYRGLRQEAATEDAREAVSLVMGPYTHGQEGQQAQGEVTGSAYYFPENSTYDELSLLRNWFDRHLEQDSAGQTADPSRVRIYVPGLDEWIGASDFPLPETRKCTYYLHSNGDANVSAVSENDPGYEGRLSTESPDDEPVDVYTYDPSDPVVPTGGYNSHWHGGITDRATSYHDRDDVLVYQTDILQEDVAVVGPITVTLYAATSEVDTDFVVTLSDVDPTDRTGGLRVAEGARRGRIGDVEADPRDSATYSEVRLLEPEEVYAWEIAVWPTARVFEEGHRIRIDVTSSDFPRYDRNLNTGEGLTSTEMTTAEQTIYHDRDRPSHVELPIVPIGELESRIIERPVPDRTTRDE